MVEMEDDYWYCVKPCYALADPEYDYGYITVYQTDEQIWEDKRKELRFNMGMSDEYPLFDL